MINLGLSFDVEYVKILCAELINKNIKKNASNSELNFIKQLEVVELIFNLAQSSKGRKTGTFNRKL